MAYKKIQFKRGTKTGMPVLRSGEPGFTQDEKSLYIGDGTANQRFLNETQTNTRIDEKIAPVTQSITNNVATLNQTITNNVSTLNQSITNNVATLNQSIASNIATVNQAITDKVKINSETTNVNFVENKIVQDGLVNSVFNFSSSGGNRKYINIGTNGDFQIIADYKYLEKQSAAYLFSIGTYSLFVHPTAGFGHQEVYGTMPIKYTTYQNGISYSEFLKPFTMVITKIGTILEINVNGKSQLISTNINWVNTSNSNFNYSWNIDDKNFSGNGKGILIYNRQLTPQEIQHNFSVLNNTSSINKINDYHISTDTDHIETPTGVTEEERYTELLKPTSKEFTSNGEAITVNNGIPKQKVLSAKIEGQTIKNISPIGTTLNTLSVSKFNRTDNATLLLENNYIKATVISDGIITVGYNVDNSMIKPSTKYILIAEIEMSSGKPCEFLAFNMVNQSRLDSIGNSRFKIACIETTPTDVNSNANSRWVRILCRNTLANEYIKLYGVSIYELSQNESNDINILSKKYKLTPFGLNSTQAVISNNGQQYTFYEPTIQGQTKVMRAPKGTQSWVEIDSAETRDTVTYDYKLESVDGDLGSVLGAYDYIDRARKVKVQTTKEIVLNGAPSEAWILNQTLTNTTRFDISILDNAKDVSTNKIFCDSFVSKYGDLSDVEHIRNSAVGYPNMLVLYINQSRLVSQSVLELKKYLQTNPITIRYQLATPIEVPMTDEEIRAYDTYKKVIDLGGLEGARNTFEFMPDGSGVYTERSKKRIVDANTGFSSNGASGDITEWLLGINDVANTTDLKLIIADNLPSEISNTNNCILLSGGKVRVRLLTSLVPTVYFNTNPTTIIYQLATPIVTTIDKTLVPAILTQLANTFTFGDAIVATKATISVPVDRISEMQAEINEIKALIQTPSNINLTMNYIEDEYNKNQSIEGVV